MQESKRPTSDTGRGETAGQETAPAIRVDDLRKTFGSGDDAVTAVDGLSVEIERGSVVGLLGPNGAGKTTTIKSLLGLVQPDWGTVEICGIDVAEQPAEAHGRIGAMLEGDRNVYWRLTVRENLEFFAGLSGRRPAAVREHHDRLLDRLDFADRADTVVNDLSKGMKQKVSLATTLARDVDLIFLDEPTLGLDVETSQDLHAELRALAAEGVTIVVTSHNMDVIEAVCDRVLIMQNGQIIADNAVDNLIELFRTQSYRITLDGPVEQAVIDRLERGFELETNSSGETLAIECHGMTSEDVYELVGVLEETGQQLRGIESIDPELGDVFLQLTRDQSDTVTATSEQPTEDGVLTVKRGED